MRWRIAEATAAAATLAFAVLVRAINLEHNPGWFTDEATHVEIVRNLLNGEVRYMAVQGGWLLFARLPLFELVLAVPMYFGVDGMLAVRATAALCGTLTVLLTWLGLRRVNGVLALACAFMVASYPQAVLYSRLGFSYNLLAVFIVVLWMTISRPGRKAALIAGLALGLGCTTDLAAFAFWPGCIPALMRKTRTERAMFAFAWAMPVAAMLAGYLIAFGDAAWFDLHYTLSRVRGGGPIEQARLLARNASVLLTQDPWWLMALIGWALWPREHAIARSSGVALLLAPLLLLGRTTPLYELSTHYTIPLLPLIGIGAGRFLHAAYIWLNTQLASAWRLMAHAILAFALLALNALLYDRAMGPFGTVIDGYLAPATDARAAAAWLNANADRDDLVVATVSIGWMLHARTADAQMVQAVKGIRTPHLPPDLQPHRWAFDPRLNNARYVVLDSWSRGWVLHQHVPGWAADLARVEQWPLAFTANDVRVYANPRFVR